MQLTAAHIKLFLYEALGRLPEQINKTTSAVGFFLMSLTKIQFSWTDFKHLRIWKGTCRLILASRTQPWLYSCQDSIYFTVTSLLDKSNAGRQLYLEDGSNISCGGLKHPIYFKFENYKGKFICPHPWVRCDIQNPILGTRSAPVLKSFCS